MILLSFGAQNHKSLRDEVVLDFVKPSLKTLRPRVGESWAHHTYPAIGIFGANASGKSTVLDALQYLLAALRDSASEWLAWDHMPRAPFRLDETHRTLPSRYVIEFVLGGERYEYGFEVDDEGVAREWLHDVPGARRRTLFSRERDRVVLSRAVRQVGPLAPRELLLSRALRLDHPTLAPVGRGLLGGIDMAPLSSAHRQYRIQSIVESLFEGTSTPESIETILQIADVGIEAIGLREDQMPPDQVELLRKLRELFEGEAGVDANSGALSPEKSDAIIRSLEFHHAGARGESFTLRDESDGTLAWLALAVGALGRLRHGGLFVVDEIDASLHPHLVDALIGLFTADSINRRGAQILFTSHDVTLLSPQASTQFAPGQVWFTEKERDGATQLYSHDDFPRHRDANVAKRYLEGRYGAVPTLAPSLVRRLLDREGAPA